MRLGQRSAFVFILVGYLATFVSEVHGDRATLLVAGPEVRTRPHEQTVHDPRYELAVPHGLSSASGRTLFLARVGVVIPSEGKALAFPLSMGLRYAPLRWSVGPLLGADFGGYLAQGRGAPAMGVPHGPEWCWSTRAVAGLSAAIGDTTTLSLYVDAMWTQTPQDSRSRTYVFSSLGMGLELRFAFAPPKQRMVNMLLEGSGAPEGY